LRLVQKKVWTASTAYSAEGRNNLLIMLFFGPPVVGQKTTLNKMLKPSAKIENQFVLTFDRGCPTNFIWTA
jgi:hypothetical protein